MLRNLSQQFLRQKSTIALLLLIVPAGSYLLSIVWRASTAEQKLFGRSDLIPMSLQVHQYSGTPIPESYGNGTFVFNRSGRKIIVYKQLINGFQHTYGSALATLELGDCAADLIFRANEYMEAYLLKGGQTREHYWDTKKDLANNLVGRRIGIEARQQGLTGRQAKRFIIQRTLDAIDKGAVINHYLDPRVHELPSLEEYGCPGLPNPIANTGSSDNLA